MGHFSCLSSWWFFFPTQLKNTVDGRNPAPVDMVNLSASKTATRQHTSFYQVGATTIWPEPLLGSGLGNEDGRMRTQCIRICMVVQGKVVG